MTGVQPQYDMPLAGRPICVQMTEMPFAALQQSYWKNIRAGCDMVFVHGDKNLNGSLWYDHFEAGV